MSGISVIYPTGLDKIYYTYKTFNTPNFILIRKIFPTKIKLKFLSDEIVNVSYKIHKLIKINGFYKIQMDFYYNYLGWR
jgi:hypothetical protein